MASENPARPNCFARLHDPQNGLCQACAVMVTCGVARMKTWLLEGPMPTIRTPQVRVNDWPPGTCRWAAREAINRLDGTFTEMDVIIPYHAICRSIKHRPGNPERTIRRVVSDLVRAGVLIRTAKAKLQHGSH